MYYEVQLLGIFCALAHPLQVKIEELGMVWQYLDKAKQQHYERGLKVKPSAKRKGGTMGPKAHDLRADIMQTGLSWQ